MTGNKSLGCIGVQSRQAMQVRADMDAGTKLSLLTSQEVSEGDWGVKTLAEIGGYRDYFCQSEGEFFS